MNRLCLVDLQKGHDKVPREEPLTSLCSTIRKSGVVETYARMVENIYEDSGVMCGGSNGFNVEVELHQRSAMSP